MAWKTISGTDVAFYAPGINKDTGLATSYYANKTVRACILYDDATISADRLDLKIRFYTSNGGCSDQFYLLAWPGESNAVFARMKTGSDSIWDVYSHTFTVYKDYTSTTFTLPNYWIINVGSSRYFSNATDLHDTAKGAWWQSHMVTAVKSKTFTGAAAKDGTAGTIASMSDTKTNTALISGNIGSAQTSNNPMKHAILYYTTDGTAPTSTNYSGSFKSDSSGGNLVSNFTSGASYAKYIPIPSGCTKIRARLYCVYKYNTAKTDIKNVNVKYRYGPIPGKPALTESSLRNGRLTLKQNFTFSFAKPEEDTDNYLPVSCLSGYRIRVQSSNRSIEIATNSIDTATDFWYDSWDSSYNKLKNGVTFTAGDTNTLTIDPTKFDFVVGDTLRMTVYGRYIDGNGRGHWSGSSNGTASISDVYTFQNAGVVKVNVDGTWYEGQVWVRTDDGWHEAETINVNVDGTWQEAQ